MDAVVRAFASDDDAVVVAADEGDVVDGGVADGGVADGGGDSDSDNASGLSDSDSENEASDMSS